MSDEKNSGVDPRFDAAFQRGFDPSVPIEEYVPPQQPRKSTTTSAALAPVAEKVTETAPRPAPSVTQKDPPVAAPQPELGMVAGADDDVDETGTAADGGADSDESPSRNPFLLFLGIIAVALVAAGIWLFVRSGEAFNSAQVRSQGDYMSLDATIHMAPFIALLGGATAIGILFVFAAKYRRKP